jgi:hypothetical protein
MSGLFALKTPDISEQLLTGMAYSRVPGIPSADGSGLAARYASMLTHDIRPKPPTYRMGVTSAG